MVKYAIADFETTTDPQDCRVWAAALIDENGDNFQTWISISDFIDAVRDMDYDIIYFHNLKFDGKFLLDYALKNGLAVSTMISDMGQFYSVTIDNQQYFDSFKILPMSVGDMPKAFAIDDEIKGDIDYTEFREIGHKLTNTEIDYIYHDVSIVAKALKHAYDLGINKMTIGSSALEAWANRKGQFVMTSLSDDEDEFIRHSYRGGISWVDPNWVRRDIGNCLCVDYNSMYPSVMSLDQPTGVPTVITGDYHGDSPYFKLMTVELHLKQDGVPFLQDSRNPRSNSLIYDTEFPHTFTLSSIDEHLMYQNYDVDVIDIAETHVFNKVKSPFTDYISYWRHIKETSEGPRRTLAKLMLNSLYGKMGANPHGMSKLPYLEDDIVKYRLSDMEDRKRQYVPIASWITACARRELINAISANRDRFIYCDTDSMYLLGHETPDNIPIHDTEFFHWSVEGKYNRARFLRSKTYIVEDEYGLHVKCAGMSKDVKKIVTWENFHFGFSNLDSGSMPRNDAKKLQPKTVPGGVVLVNRKFEIVE